MASMQKLAAMQRTTRLSLRRPLLRVAGPWNSEACAAAPPSTAASSSSAPPQDHASSASASSSTSPPPTSPPAAPSTWIWCSASTPSSSSTAPFGLRSLATKAGNWLEATEKRPVSQDSLAVIPWAGRSTLAGLFQSVASRGPNDPSVWAKLIARADVIAHSLSAKQASLILSALARAQQRPKSFLRRYSVKFVPSLIESAELVDLCGIISSLSQLNAYSEETFDLAAPRLAASAPQMDLKQISLIANAYVHAGHADTELLTRLLAQVPRRLAKSTGKDLAVMLNAIAQVPGPEALKSEEARLSLRPRGVEAATIEKVLSSIALRLPEVLPQSDLHTLTLMLNSFAQLRFAQKDAVDLLVEELLADDRRFQKISARQLAMVMNAVARLQVLNPKLLEQLKGQLRMQARHMDAQGLCISANAAAKLAFGADSFQALFTQIPRHLPKLSGRQLAMLAHAWAKAHIHNDDLFALLESPLAQRAPGMAPHEIATTLYAYSHFHKSPPELREKLLDRFHQLLDTQAVSEPDLLMVSNALGKVAYYDEIVAARLEKYVQKEPSLRNLSPQTIATFQLKAPDA